MGTQYGQIRKSLQYKATNQKLNIDETAKIGISIFNSKLIIANLSISINFHNRNYWQMFAVKYLHVAVT